MKKLLIASIMALGLTGFAFAQQGPMGMGSAGNYPCAMGMGSGGGYPCAMGNQDGNYPCANGGPHMKKGHRGHGMGMMQGRCGNMQDMQVTVKTADEAKAKVQDVIKTSYKGYKITKTEEFTVFNGNQAFRVFVNDAGGNEFVFHVNPFGNVRGPGLAMNMPATPQNMPKTK